MMTQVVNEFTLDGQHLTITIDEPGPGTPPDHKPQVIVAIADDSNGGTVETCRIKPTDLLRYAEFVARRLLTREGM